MTEIRDDKRLDCYFCNSKSREEIAEHIALGFPSSNTYEVADGNLPIHLMRRIEPHDKEKTE